MTFVTYLLCASLLISFGLCAVNLPLWLLLSLLLVGVAGIAGVASFLLAANYQLQKPIKFDSKCREPTSSNTRQGLTIGRICGNWDAVVIGSGISGLTAAALLSKRGKKVLVLEQHYIAGGCTHTFTDKGFSFDTGIHYVGGVGNTSRQMRRLLDYVSNGKLKWAAMDVEGHDVAVFGRGDPKDREFIKFPKGIKKMTRMLHKRFPDDTKAINDFFSLTYEVQKHSKKYYAMKCFLPRWLNEVLAPRLLKRFFQLSDQTLEQVLCSLTENEKLKSTLTYIYGDYGLPPEKASFAIHALVWNHFLGGASYPIGGAESIASSIIPVIENPGGKVLVRASVQSVIIENGVAVGVRIMKSRKLLEVRAPLVISSAGAWNTYHNLITKEHQHFVKEPVEQLKLHSPIQPSAGHLILFLGFQGNSKDLKLPTSNFWVFPTYDMFGARRKHLESEKGSAEFGGFFVNFPSAKDPSWDQRKHPVQLPKGGEFVNLDITEQPESVTICNFVCETKYDWFKKYENERVMHRSEEYQQIKRDLTKRMLSELYKLFPQLKDRLIFCDLGTPLSSKHYLGSARGSSYGLDHTPERFAATWLRPETPIKNLYLTGADIISAGFTPAAMSGLMTLGAISKKEYLWNNLNLYVKKGTSIF